MTDLLISRRTPPTPRKTPPVFGQIFFHHRSRVLRPFFGKPAITDIAENFPPAALVCGFQFAQRRQRIHKSRQTRRNARAVFHRAVACRQPEYRAFGLDSVGEQHRIINQPRKNHPAWLPLRVWHKLVGFAVRNDRPALRCLCQLFVVQSFHQSVQQRQKTAAFFQPADAEMAVKPAQCAHVFGQAAHSRQFAVRHAVCAVADAVLEK